MELAIGIFDLSHGKNRSRAPFEIFYYLSTNLNSEGRHWLLNAIANQLRYPNSHTYYFSRLLLELFLNVKQDFIKEQITRVLLERLIVSRPQPWGLLVTFIELLQNNQYHFWEHSFIKCAPDIENLFRSVSKQSHQSTAKDR
jgi:CCR4-NOT transcription complex subunit 1